MPTPVELVVDERQVRRQAQQRLDDRRGDQRLLQESLRQVRDRVHVATIGPEAWWGVGALTLLTVLGVAPPILYLGRRESDVGAPNVAVVLTLFAIAILALLTYLVGLIVWAQRLGATADRPPAPVLPADPETLPAASRSRFPARR